MRNPDLPLDFALLLKEARLARGLTQKDLARMSGVGEKTLSSFETGQRISTMKVAQLRSLLRAMGLTLDQFFARDIYPADCAAVKVISHRSILQERAEDLRRWIIGARDDGITPAEISDLFLRMHLTPQHADTRRDALRRVS